MRKRAEKWSRIKSGAASVRCALQRTCNLSEYVDDFENSFFRSIRKNYMDWCRSGADRTRNDGETKRAKVVPSRHRRRNGGKLGHRECVLRGKRGSFIFCLISYSCPRAHGRRRCRRRRGLRKWNSTPSAYFWRQEFLRRSNSQNIGPVVNTPTFSACRRATRC